MPLFLILFSLRTLTQDIVPSERRIDWDPGIPGGIPDYPAGVSVMDYGALADGVTDDTQAFLDAITACPQQHAITIPSGTYLITDRLNLRKSITLRGAGPDQTFLKFEKQPEAPDYQRTNIWIGQRIAGFSASITGGAVRGSYQITVSDVSGFAVDDLVEIRQDNDESVMARPIVPVSQNDSWAEGHWGWRAVGQFLLITDIDAGTNTLTFQHPLYFTYNPAMNPAVTQWNGPARYAGVEDLHMELVADANGYYGNIHFDGSVYCWARNVRSYKCSRSHIGLWGGLGNEIRDSYFEFSHGYAGGEGYGVNMIDRTTNNLVENNIFDFLQGKMLTAVGACGNVYAYNYCRISMDDLGPYEDMHADMGAHGHHSYMNLFEGNSTNRAHVDRYWGSNANFVFLRNKMLCPDGYVRSSDPVHIEKNNIEMSFVGNILHHENSMEDRRVWYFPDEPDDFSDPELTMNTLISHGNYDFMSENVQWDPDIDNQDIPDSYYLDGKPGFFTNAPWGDTSWPLIGPDLLHAGLIPAQQRFCDLNGITPPDPPTGLSATAEDNRITLAWTDNSTDEQGFRIEQSLDGIHFFRQGVTLPDSNRIVFSGLRPFTTYYFRVCSYIDEPGNSAWSDIASASTFSELPLAGICRYPFSGNANNALSGDYHGIVHGPVLCAGKTGQAYAFDGLDDYIHIPKWDPDAWRPGHSPLYGDEQAFTIAAWICPDIVSGHDNFIISDDSRWGDFTFGLTGNRLNLRYINGTGQRYGLSSVETATVKPGVFTHVAASYDPEHNIVRLFINGEQAAIDRMTRPLGTSGFDSLYIGLGGDPSGTITYFDGIIDEVHIYGSVLSDRQIQMLAETQALLSVRVLLEGPYTAGTMQTGLRDAGILPMDSPYDASHAEVIPDQVVDWIWLELRSNADGSGENYGKSVFLRNDGTVLDTDGAETVAINAPEGYYYISVTHRNHLAVMSPDPVPIFSDYP